MVTPEMRLGWHRRMVGLRWTYPAPARGQPSVPQQAQSLIVRLATENPRWGDQRIRWELLGLGCQVSASSIARVSARQRVGAYNLSTSRDLDVFVDQPTETIDP
jgi:putative transposase